MSLDYYDNKGRFYGYIPKGGAGDGEENPNSYLLRGGFDEERLGREMEEAVNEGLERRLRWELGLRWDGVSSWDNEVEANRRGPPIARPGFDEERLRREMREYRRAPDELGFEASKWRDREYGPSGDRSPGKGGRIPGGMVGYEERKAGELFEAAADRKESLGKPEKERLERIEQVARAYPQVRIREIAEKVVPWDYDVFKRLAALAVAEYKKSLLS
jgi:hypothetical protein